MYIDTEKRFLVTFFFHIYIFMSGLCLCFKEDLEQQLASAVTAKETAEESVEKLKEEVSHLEAEKV